MKISSGSNTYYIEDEMSVSLTDSQIYGGLFGDDELSSLFSDESEISTMIRVEIALAKVQADLEIVPKGCIEIIKSTLSKLEIKGTELAKGTKAAGIPVPALVAKLREAVGEEFGSFIHYGATSQDIMDTGLVLRLKSVCAIIDARLSKLIESLAKQANNYKNTVVPARTRSQQATPTVLGLKVASLIPPLRRCKNRLSELKSRLLVVQFGGASGNMSSLQGKGIEVMEGLARELELKAPEMPWHTQRDGIAEFSGLMAMIATTLGKLGLDIILLGQSEVRELFASSGGGSSTMPQKANPVAAESLVAISKNVANLHTTILNAVVHAQERDGAAWASEWLALPQLTVLTGSAINTSISLVENLTSDVSKVMGTLDSTNGMIMAEAAAFALAEEMSLAKAQDIVKKACMSVAESKENLIDYLEKTVKSGIDWNRLRNPSTYLGNSNELINRVAKLDAEIDNIQGPKCNGQANKINLSELNRHRDTIQRILALTDGESDPIVLMATVSCELYQSDDRFDWVGFYRNMGNGLLKIGPYQGGHGCLTIPFSKGVCGRCASTEKVEIVNNVLNDPAHIACSSETRSELVLPVFDTRAQLIGVLDIDSNMNDAFDEEDVSDLEFLLIQVFGSRG